MVVCVHHTTLTAAPHVLYITTNKIKTVNKRKKKYIKVDHTIHIRGI
jgi:hypothetical protein